MKQQEKAGRPALNMKIRAFQAQSETWLRLTNRSRRVNEEIFRYTPT